MFESLDGIDLLSHTFSSFEEVYMIGKLLGVSRNKLGEFKRQRKSLDEKAKKMLTFWSNSANPTFAKLFKATKLARAYLLFKTVEHIVNLRIESRNPPGSGASGNTTTRVCIIGDWTED